MTETEQRLRAWLANPANIHLKQKEDRSRNGFDHVMLRARFVTRNGHSISIQQGASHYCDADSVELWYCPHRPILDSYGSEDEYGGRHPYGYVPISVVADYIDVLEGGTLPVRRETNEKV